VTPDPVPPNTGSTHFSGRTRVMNWLVDPKVGVHEPFLPPVEAATPGKFSALRTDRQLRKVRRLWCLDVLVFKAFLPS
jgi:hypothetical protein